MRAKKIKFFIINPATKNKKKNCFLSKWHLGEDYSNEVTIHKCSSEKEEERKKNFNQLIKYKYKLIAEMLRKKAIYKNVFGTYRKKAVCDYNNHSWKNIC